MTQQQPEKYLWGAATKMRGTIDAGAENDSLRHYRPERDRLEQRHSYFLRAL